MALKITDDCINCDVCEPACPNTAIFFGATRYEINPDRCTECIGHFDEPQCMMLCPVDCIPSDLDHVETPAMLKRKYTRLMTTATSDDTSATSTNP